jgi:hypothetical protein
MNQLRNTIFYRMYLLQPNHFVNYGINNNQRFYTEKFEKNNISGIFNYHKLIYNYDCYNENDITNNVWSIVTNIAIDDNINNTKYMERYEFKKFTNTYTQQHEFGKMEISESYLYKYQPLTFDDLPKHIKNFIYMKNDKDIISK